MLDTTVEARMDLLVMFFYGPLRIYSPLLADY